MGGGLSCWSDCVICSDLDLLIAHKKKYDSEQEELCDVSGDYRIDFSYICRDVSICNPADDYVTFTVVSDEICDVAVIDDSEAVTARLDIYDDEYVSS